MRKNFSGGMGVVKGRVEFPFEISCTDPSQENVYPLKPKQGLNGPPASICCRKGELLDITLRGQGGQRFLDGGRAPGCDVAAPYVVEVCKHGVRVGQGL